MLDYLKTKCTSLGAEAKLIKQYEQKRLKLAKLFRLKNKDRSEAYNMKVFNGLYRHRIDVVRPEARAANIAYGFLRGRKYKQIERNAYVMPDWKKIEKLVLTFAERNNPRYNQSVEERFKQWLDDALYWFGTKNHEKFEVDSIGNNSIGYMEKNSEYQLSLKADRRKNYIPNRVCLDSEQGI